MHRFLEQLIKCNDIHNIELKFRKAKSDSIQEIYYDLEKRPEISNLLNIYALLSGKAVKDIENEYRGKFLSVFKKDLADMTISTLSPIAKEFGRIMQSRDYVVSILDKGKERAGKIATNNLQRVKEIVGVNN